MFQWMKRLFRSPQPAGPIQSIRTFTPLDTTITKEVITADGNEWVVDVEETQTLRLFEIDSPQVESCLLTYRADLKSADVKEKSYLEMWCRMPDGGEYFSKAFHNALKGTNDWDSYEVPFYLKRNQQPDQIKLNLTVEGGGKVWMKNIELSYTPLK